MGSVITSKKGLLKLVKGQINVEVDGSNQPAKDGEQLPKGAVLHIGENATYEITFDDGTKLSNEVAPSETTAAASGTANEAALDEIQALQDLIASGEDPTQNLPETAAGNTPGSDGNSGYVTLARSGTETIAASGYSTSGQALTGTTVNIPQFTIAADSPSALANDSNTSNEDTVATGNVLDNDTDVDSTLSVVSFEISGTTYAAGTEVTLEGGVLVLNTDGSYTFTPNENWNGQVPVITYTTNTGSTATLTINISPVDDPSILANDSATVAEDTAATGNVLDNDSDIDSTLSVVSFTVNGDTVTAGTTVSLEGGSLVINADGSYTFTPNANWNGQVPVITYTTNTGSTATLTINVTPVDDASALANDTNTVDEDTVATGNVLTNDSDVDNTLSVVSFTVNGDTVAAGTTVELEGGDLVINADGSYTFTPNANWNGQVPVITYTTNTGSTATLTINVNPVDDPSILANDSATVAEDTVATGNVLDNDSDIDSTLSVVSFTVNGDTVTVGTTVSLEGGSLVINTDGSYTFTPNANWNGQVPVITYTTNTGSTATLTINISPVDDTSILANDSATVAEDTAATGNVLDNDSDIDSPLSVVSFTVNGDTVTAGTTVSLEGGSLVINADGSYTFTPNANWNGQVPVITYTTNTGSTATLTINVTPVDDASALANDTNTVDEDSIATGNVLTNDSDVDNELSVVSFTVNNDTVTAGTTVTLEDGSLVINADGSYTFTPNANWNGTVPVITYTTNTGSTATLTIKVTPVDDPTTVTGGTSGNGAEDAAAITGTLTATDADGLTDGTVFTVSGNPANGTATIDPATGLWSYVPVADYYGNDSFTVTITDDDGNSVTQVISVTVTPVADIVADTALTNEDTAVIIDVLDNDTFENSDAAVTGVTNGANGTVTINADGTVTYTPSANFHGTDSFTYTVTSGGVTETTTVNVTVLKMPRPSLAP
ncbi:retention module-containing protein [Shewanella sp. SM101]|uniref:retention module-containing protein n=1 Tax=Shewanella sp. SM101 TaxID=2912789 RepID=UPI0021D952A1|nr:retention module-containing protein [Shewanella sp. SM101]MCU8105403.1 retention module-containing protein [Shewanella sp. SM101]